MNPLAGTKMISEETSMSSVVLQCHMSRCLKLTVASTTQEDYAKAVELTTFTNKTEPIAEYTGVNQKHGLTLSTFHVFHLAAINSEALPLFRMVVHPRAPHWVLPSLIVGKISINIFRYNRLQLNLASSVPLG